MQKNKKKEMFFQVPNLLHYFYDPFLFSDSELSSRGDRLD
jgi:hypothetical protein